VEVRVLSTAPPRNYHLEIVWLFARCGRLPFKVRAILFGSRSHQPTYTLPPLIAAYDLPLVYREQPLRPLANQRWLQVQPRLRQHWQHELQPPFAGHVLTFFPIQQHDNKKLLLTRKF
jgi:hypothetical protein